MPTIIMMVFMSIYSVVDGFFVSHFVGKEAFVAINLIYPFIQVLASVGFMFSSGGSALVAKLLGQQRQEDANAVFSLVIYVVTALGFVLGAGGLIFLRPIAIWLGADAQTLPLCLQYARILLPVMPLYILQPAFSAFVVAAGRPALGLYISLVGGVCNIVLDALFIIGFDMGTVGAALASAIAQGGSSIIPIVFFLRRNNTVLHLGKTHWNSRALWQTCSNGLSEFLSNISFSIVVMVYNWQLLRYIGNNGVAAYAVIQIVNFIFQSVFFGYCYGTSAIVSYHYGAQNRDELHGLLTRSLHIIGVFGILATGAAQLLAHPLAQLYVGYDPELLQLTEHAFRIYSITFLLCGFNFYASSFFTGLNNGPISAFISVMRTLVCEIGALLLLPLIFGVDSIWYSIIFADAIALIISTALLLHYRSRYGY